jgi:hypothetical protein
MLNSGYVKLIAKPDTWFEAGTEVWHYDHNRRLTLEEYAEWEKTKSIILVRGIRVCEDNDNERGMGYQPGEIRIDSECCMLDEFEVEVVEDGNEDNFIYF